MSDVTLPTEDEISQLPRWARVALAARCARRALPHHQKNWPDAKKKLIESIEKAVTLAEEATTTGTVYPDDANIIATLSEAVTGSMHDAKYAALYAAIYASIGASKPNASLGAAILAPAFASRAGVAIEFIRADFQQVLDTSQREGWTDDTPVPPTVFEPNVITHTLIMSVEDFWRAARGRPFQLIVDAFATDDADPQEVRTRLVGLFRELNDYSLLKYGKGLTIDEFRQYLLAGVPEVVS